jgi:hypothetical protein
MRAVAALLCLLLLAGCASAPPAMRPVPQGDALAPQFAALQAQQGGQLYRIDPAASAVRVYVFRAGRAARLGHNHIITAPRFEAWLLWPEALAEARFELRLSLADLQLDEPALRAATGGGFAAPLSAEAIAATRANMLGERGLDAARHPLLGLRLLAQAGEPPRLAARVEIALGERRHALSLPLSLQGPAEDGTLRIDGSFVLRHSDLGLQPFSVGGGLLAVQDELVLEFSLLARPLR